MEEKKEDVHEVQAPAVRSGAADQRTAPLPTAAVANPGHWTSCIGRTKPFATLRRPYHAADDVLNGLGLGRRLKRTAVWMNESRLLLLHCRDCTS